MNLVTAAPLWLIILFGCAMLAAAIEDAIRLRISNVTSGLVFIGAIVAALLAGPTILLWQNLLVFVVLLALGTFAFSARWLGGGDVKLFAAAGLWFDLRSAPAFVAVVFIAGGLVAICYLLARPLRKRVAGQSKHTQVPYGIAIALGALAMVALGRSAEQHREPTLPPIRIAPHR